MTSETHASEAIFTTYFFNNPDPQRKQHAPADDYSYIAPWHQSLQRLPVDGVIFHDGLSPDFIAQYSTDRIRFFYVAPEEFIYSMNDFRFLIYRDYLRDHPELQAVFMTDGNDVTIAQNPFEQIRPDKIYVGSELEDLRSSQWLKRRYYLLDQDRGKYRAPNSRWRRLTLFNAGILGGSRSICMEFLDHMAQVFEDLDTDQLKLNVNMAAFNHVIYNNFKRKHVTGEPLHSRYKSFESDRRDVAFIHK